MSSAHVCVTRYVGPAHEPVCAECLWLRVTEAARFLDEDVREWLPNEHTGCGIDSGCAHGFYEREMFERLDAMVARLRGGA